MTMPVPPGTRIVELPPPQFPMLMMMFTDILVPGSGPSTVTQWVVSEIHPYDNTVKVLRMFADEEGVEVYSASGVTCIRDFIPMRFIRFMRETMPPEIFAEELEDAQAEDDDPEPEPEIEPEIPDQPNGQASS